MITEQIATSVEVLAAVVHLYKDGQYTRTVDNVFTPDCVESFVETYNKINPPEYRAVAECVPFVTVAPPTLID